MYDVIIIGAGPAGTAAGYYLARKGFSVLLLDRRSFPRKKACAGGITPKAMALFNYDISHLVCRTFREIKIVRPGNRSFIIKNKNPLCYITRRSELDAYSLTRARAAGCRFKKIDKLTSLKQDGHGVSLTVIQDGEPVCYTSQYLIGADGANSKTQRLTGRTAVSSNVKLPALEADVRVSCAAGYAMEFDFSKNFSGYYWLFPRKHHVNIGIFSARADGHLSQKLLVRYARLRFGTGLLSDVKGYPIGTSQGTVTPGRGRVLLAGDAAGLAEPLLGEGIYAALKSGILSARAVEYALNLSFAPPIAAMDWYRQALSPLLWDLWLYQRSAFIMYRFPGPALAAASRPMLHNYFSRGYARAKTLHEMLLPF